MRTNPASFHRQLCGLLLLTCLAPALAAERASERGLVQDQVDWATFLARNDPVWKRPGKNYFEAPFVGNGLAGAMIWQQSDHEIRIAVGRTDVTDHRTGPEEAIVLKGRLPIGHFLLTTAGTIRGGTMRLRLHDAEAAGVFETDRGRISWRLLTHAEQPVSVVDLVAEKDEEGCSWSFVPEESVVPRKKSPQRVNPAAAQEAREAARVCIQTRTAGGDYATAWQEVRDGRTRRLFISIADRFPAGGAADDAVAAVRKAAAAPFDEWLASHRRWWHAYYPASFISVPHPRMESCYWIQMYKLGSSIRKGGPLCDLFGPWFKPSGWPAIWWNLNTQMLYWPFPSANRLDMAENLSDALERNKANLIANVPQEFRGDSAGISRCTGQDLLETYDRWHERANLVWTCHNLWLQYRCTMDERFLREQLYPLLRRAVSLYLHLIEKGPDGKYHLPNSHSPEAFTGPDTNYDLASLRWGCERLLWMDRRLGTNDPQAARWRDVLEHLVDYAVDQTGFMGGPGKAAPRGHRHWSHLIMIYPYYQVNWDQPQQRELIERSWRYWAWDRVPNTWSQAVMSSMASSMGKADDALRHLDRALATRNLAPNTMHTEGGNPCSETHGGLCQMLHDMLLQSWGDKIRIFPGVPSAWADLTFHNLRAEGAFLVSAARKAGKTQWVRIKSLAGEPCFVRPGLAGTVKVHCPGKTIALRKLADEVYELSLAKGDEVLLYDSAEVPPAIVQAVAADAAAQNPYGL